MPSTKGVVAFVNGEEAGPEYILQPGDELEFIKRFGSKGLGDFFTPEQLRERWRIDKKHYEELVDRGLPILVFKDGTSLHPEIAVDEWFRQSHYDLPQARVLRHPEGEQTVPLTAIERMIVDALGDEELKGAAIARRIRVAFTSQFRSTLSYLFKRGILGKGRSGYYVQAMT